MNKDDLDLLRNSLSKTKDGKVILVDPPAYAVKMLEDVCQRTGLDWKLRHCYLMDRSGKWRVELSIDGFRAVANSDESYNGQAGPFWTLGPDQPWTDIPPDAEPYAAKVGVYRKGQSEPTWGVAKYKDYAVTGFAGQMWKKFPSTMIAKCFDDRTEVLTDQGFQKFSEVTGQVLQVTEEGLKPTDARPWSQVYSGPMVQLVSDDLNFCVTPNHEMVTDQGVISAGDLFENARVRTKYRIPRVVPESTVELDICDELLELAGIIMADGSAYSGKTWRVAVSRQDKVDDIHRLSRHIAERTIECAGNVATLSSGREIVTQHNQTQFLFPDHPLLNSDKTLKSTTNLSSRQARLLVDAWLRFDGSGGSGVTQRLHTSNDEHAAQFETLAVIAGYSVGPRYTRKDECGKDRCSISVSERDAIPVKRHLTPSRGFSGIAGSMYSGMVWCVTVPSGEIVVRREGFSMRVKNCAEMLALRKALPGKLGGLYGAEEMAQADKGDPKPAAKSKAPINAEAPNGGDLTATFEGEAPDDLSTFTTKIENAKTKEELQAIGKEVQTSSLGLEVKMELSKTYKTRKDKEGWA